MKVEAPSLLSPRTYTSEFHENVTKTTKVSWGFDRRHASATPPKV